MVTPVYVPFEKEPGHHYEYRPRYGKVYIYDRPSHWSRAKGQMVLDKATLLGAEVPGDPTKIELLGHRRKAALAAMNQESQTENDGQNSTICHAKIERNRAMAVLDNMFRASGVDGQTASALHCIDKDGMLNLAAKGQTLMRYMFLFETATAGRLDIFQREHSCPYPDVITESEVGQLYELVGNEPTCKMIFFQERYRNHKGELIIAFDSTTYSTYSSNLSIANKSYDAVNAKTHGIKLFQLYAIDTNEPIAWFLLPGSMTDCKALSYAVDELRAIGIDKLELVADSGFMSEENIALLESKSIGFVVRNPNHRSVVRKAFDAHLPELNYGSCLKQNPQVAGAKVALGNDRFLYLYKNLVQNHVEASNFNRQLYALTDSVSAEGWKRANTDEDLLPLIDKFLVVNEIAAPSKADAAHTSRREVSLNSEAVIEYCNKLSTFALISSKDTSPDEIYRIYFMREHIEDSYACLKGSIDDRFRVQSDPRLEGRTFFMFGTLCVRQYSQSCINIIKNELRRFIAVHKDENGYKGQAKAYQHLLSWLDNSSLGKIFDWLDGAQDLSVQTNAAKYYWSEPILKRDQLLLAFLGVDDFPEGYKELPNWEWLKH